MALPSHLILPLLMIIGTTADTTIVKLMKVFLNTEAPTYLKLGRLYLKKSNHLGIYKKAPSNVQAGIRLATNLANNPVSCFNRRRHFDIVALRPRSIFHASCAKKFNTLCLNWEDSPFPLQISWILSFCISFNLLLGLIFKDSIPGFDPSWIGLAQDLYRYV